MEKVYTVQQAARELNIVPRTLTTWTKLLSIEKRQSFADKRLRFITDADLRKIRAYRDDRRLGIETDNGDG